MALFEKDQPGKGDRRQGSSGPHSTALLEAIAADFEQFGEEAVKIALVEKPAEYLRIVASLLPKEFEIVDSRLPDLTDEELDRLIEVARRQIIDVTPDARSREEAS